MTEVKAETISALNPLEGVRLVRALLWAEAWRLKIPRHNVVISEAITTPDGGIDASVRSDGPHDSILIPGLAYYQVKTGESFKPWQPAKIREELFGDKAPGLDALGNEVKRCLEQGAMYCLIALGHDLTSEQAGDAEKCLREYFSQCGFGQARVLCLGVGQIIGALSRHPSLCLDVNGLGMLPFQTTSVWATSADMTPSLALGESQEAFIASLRESLDAPDIQHIRVIGEPGIGKSRLVLETMQRERDLSANTIFVRQASDFQNSPLFTELLRPGRDYSLILVIDECDDYDRGQIWRGLKNRAAVKLVTIDHGPKDSGGSGMRTLAVPALEEAQVEQILRAYIGERDGLLNWAAWCEGSARVAHALGENLRDHPDDVLRTPGTVPIWDRFISGYGEEKDGGRARLVLRHLALFEKFGFREPVEKESDYIAKLIERADPSITRAKFNEIVSYYQKRRILQGDRTLRIVPKALRIHLWRGWWESYGIGANIEAMLDEMPQSLYAWFMRPFSHAHDIPSALDVVKKLLHPQSGLFAKREFLAGDVGSRFVSVLAEADPAGALALLRTMQDWPDEEIRILKSSRQELAFAISRIAVWRHCFRHAAMVLGRLSLGDESSNSNNARGIFVELFVPIGAATQVPFVDRVALVKELLDADTAFDRDLGLAAAREAFNTRGHTRVVGVEFQGSRARIEFWQPSLWDELITPWCSLLTELMQKRGAGDLEWRMAVDAAIRSAIEGMLRANTLHDECVEALKILSVEDHNFEPLLGFLITLLRYSPETLPEPVRTELHSIKLAMNGTTFEERLRRYVLTDVWDDNDEDDDKGPKEKAQTIRQALAVEATSDFALLKKALPTLFKSRAHHVVQFGRDVALAAKDDKFDQAMLAEAAKHGADGTYPFLSGYLNSVFLSDPDRWERLADKLLSAPQRWIGLAVACSGVSEMIFERLLALHREGVMDNLRMLALAHDPIQPELGIQRTRRLIKQVLELRGDSFYEVAVEMAERSLCKGDDHDPEDEELVFSVLCLGAESRGNIGAMPDHYWGKLAKRFRARFPARDLELFDAILAGAIKVHSLGYRGNLTKVAGQICESHPGETWKRAGNTLKGEHGYVISMWLGDVGHYGEPLKQAILHFKADDIFAWIDEEPAERARYIADVVPRTLEAGQAGDLTREFIKRYARLPHVGGAVRSHFRTGAWSGTASARYGRERELARKWLAEISDPKIQDWLSDYIDALNSEIEQARIREEREF